MAPAIVILFIMSMGLIRSDDNVAMESNVHYQTVYKVDPDDNDGHIEKKIQNYPSFTQNHYHTISPKFQYSNEHLLKNGGDLRYSSVEAQHNQLDLHKPSVPDNSGHATITTNQNSQSLPSNHIHQEYANMPQALYLHQQYPVEQDQVYGSQPSHLYQVEKDEHEGKIVGFSSYVEHFTPKDDDEELQSALKEGSVKDIKRLVPKSGISFKIYQDDKNWESNSENQKTEIRSHFSNYVTQNHVKPEPTFKDHRGQSKFRIEVPAKHIKTHEFRQSQTHLEEPKQIHLSQTSESTPQQHQVQTLAKFSHEPQQIQQIQQAHLTQEFHYTKPEENSQRQSLDITAKGSSGLESGFPIRVKEDNFNHEQYGAGWNSPSAKVQVLHPKSHYQNNWKAAEDSNKPEGLSGSVKQVSVEPTAHEQFQQLRSYADIVVGKTIQNNFDHQKALEGSTSFDIKNAIGSTNSLDHESHQTSTEVHNKGASQINPNELHSSLGKQSLTYIVPNIQVQPTTSLLIGNNVHGASLQGGYHTKYIKDAMSSTTELSRPVVSSPSIHDINGKYFSQPQTVQIWNSGHYAQGNALTSNHLRQSLVAFPDAKHQEILQHLKASNPQTSVTVLSTSLHPQQQQQSHQQRAIGFYRDVSLTKFPQDIQFQYKKTPNYQVPHIRPIQLVSTNNPELNLYKGKLPNINLNTVVMKPDLTQLFKESSGKKIIPILVKKRKNRSNKEVTGVVYGQTTANRGGVKAKLRQDKTIRVNYVPESSQNINHYLPKNEDNNEFSVSASYKVDRSLQTQRD